jgi:predicted ester cyclase
MFPVRGVGFNKPSIREEEDTLCLDSRNGVLSVTHVFSRLMSATTRRPSEATPSEPRNREVTPAPSTSSPANALRRLIEEGFNEGDLKVLDEVLDPGFVEHQALAPGVPRTRDAVSALIRALRTGFPDIRLSIEAIDTVGDRVWARIRATGTNKGPFMGNPPTGRSIAIDVLDVVRMDGGRIAEHWGVPDHLTLMEQLGV